MTAKEIIEILKEHEVFEVDIPDELSRNDALHDIAVRIDHAYQAKSKEKSDERYEMAKKFLMGMPQYTNPPSVDVLAKALHIASGKEGEG